jgi:hypothetical protein
VHAIVLCVDSGMVSLNSFLPFLGAIGAPGRSILYSSFSFSIIYNTTVGGLPRCTVQKKNLSLKQSKQIQSHTRWLGN